MKQKTTTSFDWPATSRSVFGSFRRNRSRLVGRLLALFVLIGPIARAMAETRDGFSSPYRIVNVASSETGIVEVVEVRKGTHVKSGQPLARLNSTVHKALLRIADVQMKAKGRLVAAEAEQRLRKIRLTKLEELASLGHAHQDELDRSRTEWEVSNAQVSAAEEERLIRTLEHEKIKAQLDRRTVRSPLDGVVTHILKEEGEFIAPNDPILMVVAQLDTLLAKFSVMQHQAETLKVGQEVSIEFPTSGQKATGIVEFLSPITDAESGTVLLEIRIDNSKGTLRSGERCTIELPDNS